MCRTPSLVGSTCAGIDATKPVDVAATADVAPESCTFEIVSMNFDPADLPASEGAWTVTGDVMFTTGTGGGRAVPQMAGNDLWLVHHSTFVVEPGATLTISGMHPLVIAADTIDVKGTIIVENGSGHPSCDAQRGANSCDKAAGGGGAGYGARGGDGGGPPLMAGGTAANIVPVPLRGGCPGAQGGDGTTGPNDSLPRPGGLGGAAGGGLQLSGRLKVDVSGQIFAHGKAGEPGKSDQAGGGACGITGRAAGGGGGGGGGMIFVESCETIIQPTARLCASGGGGGGGSGGGNTNTGMRGSDGNCDGVALGGAGEIANSQGGNGGYDGQPATNGSIASRGGGGGGGAVGRIFIRQVAGDPVTAGATIRPPANRAQ